MHPSSPKPFLSLHDAGFRLGSRLVFENTSWVFQRHEHWAVIGANGSGKSLFGDALRGGLPLVQGELRYHFRPAAGATPEEAIGHIAFEERRATAGQTVVQSRWDSAETEAALIVSEWLTYERVMAINPFEVAPEPDNAKVGFERRRRRAIEWLGIAPFLDRPLISLSNGETQRFQLARALCRPLRLLILDDPFVGLDDESRKQILSLFARLMRTPLRILIITTRPEDLPALVTHVLCVSACRVIAAGPRSKILADPLANSALGLQNGQISPPPSRPRPRPRFVGMEGRGRGRGGTELNGELVSLRNVTVRYGAAALLKNIDWTIRSGESWALLGPNGSGKSTLLSLISGDNPQAYANDVKVLGRQRGDGESVWELKRQIGLISPEFHFHFDHSMTCLETVQSGFHDSVGLFEPVTATQRRSSRQWLARFSLLPCADAPLFTLSAGLQRMVLLGRALVKRPRLLLLDEPCQGLDAAHRELFVRTVDGLIRDGSETAIYVTHRPDEIPPSITRALRLDRGRGTILSL